MNRKPFSWMSPAIGVGTSSILPGQCGVIAVAPIKAGEVIMVMGGLVVDIPTYNPVGSFGEEYGIDISEHFSFCPCNEEALGRMPQFFSNHSCEPNAGFLDQLQMVALRAIASGEEISYDYAFVLFSNPGHEPRFRVECRCGSAHCWKQITSDDWQIPELHQKFGRWILPFLRRRFYDLHPGWAEAAVLEVPCAVESSGPLAKGRELARRVYLAPHPQFAAA
jgi:hypothetical protein